MPSHAGALAYPSAALWTPASLPSLGGWWDASDTATITIGTGCSAITDKSGNSRTLSQSTGSLQPASGTRTLNSLNTLDFDGSNDYLAGGDVLDVRTNGLTIAVVCAHDTADADGTYVCKSRAQGVPNRYSLGHSSGTMEAFIAASDGNKVVSFSDTSTSARHIMMTWTRGTGIELYVGNSSQGTASSTDTTDWDTAYTFLVGAINSTSGGEPPFGNYFDGRMAEIVVCLAALGSSDRASLQSYFAAKWGI